MGSGPERIVSLVRRLAAIGGARRRPTGMQADLRACWRKQAGLAEQLQDEFVSAEHLLSR
ncbi:MAG: hypothetical protein R3B96_07720 [Pirellulaceae bacterium]